MSASTFLARETTALLNSNRFGASVRAFETVDSTNRIAAEWAAAGAPDGSVVMAEHQTAGRGRQGRTWQDTPGANLLFSLVLRPKLATDERSLVSIAAAVATAEAIDAFTEPLRTAVKWPNDLLLHGRKYGGMLLESSFNGSRPSAAETVVLGIGINVNQTNFPPSLAERATSLLLEVGRPIDRAALLAKILERIEHWYDALLTGERLPLLRSYDARFVGRGAVMTLYQHASLDPVRGTALGVTDKGALRLRLPEGERIFHAGDVTTQAPH